MKNDSQINWHIHYIGRQYNSSVDTSPSIESKIIPKQDVSFYQLNCGKLDRRWLPNTLKGIPQTLSSLFRAIKLINNIKPQIIVSFGGYVSVPVIIAGFLKKIPSITHEQTLTNSLTTKINSRFVTKVALSFDNTKQKSQLPQNKIAITGNLLRHELFHPQKSPFGNQLQKIKTKIIFVTAGNQGSHTINTHIQKLLPQLKNFFIIHQTGQNDFTEFKKIESQYSNYLCFNYLDSHNIGHIFLRSDLIISRSGANTSQEILALNKKSILIPLKVSQQNEQVLNANFVKEKLPQLTQIILESHLDSISLLKAIHHLLSLKSIPHHTKNSDNLQLLKLIHEII